MAVKETLELDIRRALAQANEVGAAYEARLRAAAKGLEEGLAGTATQLRAGASAAGEIGTGLRKAGEEATKAGKGVDQYRQSQERSTEETKRNTDQQTKNEASLKKVGTQALLTGTAIAAGLGVAELATIRFDQQISFLAATSDAGSKRLGQLREAALDAGAATVFSASQAAQAEVELAKAGISTGDILRGALRGSLDLASAGQLDLARAAEIAAQAMTIFQLRGSDVGHIADVLAAGANKSTASVESLAQGMENVGGVAARLFNVSLEETVGTLALFDQNALRGAEGGTALRSALLSLATPTEKQRAAMAAVNLEVFDAQGKFVGLSKLAGNLQTAFAGASEEQRNLALGIIFGNYGIRAANVLYQEGEAGVRKWTKAVNDQGAAQRFADKALDNLAGDIEQFKGAVEVGLIGAGSRANGVLRFMTQRATEAAQGLAKLPGPIQAGAFGLAGLTSVGLVAVGVAGTVADKWSKVEPALRNAGVAGKFVADNAGKIAGTAAGLTGVAIGYSMIGQSAESSAIGVASLAASSALIGFQFGGAQGAAIGAGIGLIAGIGKAAFDSGESVEEFRQRIANLGKEIESLGARGAAREALGDIGRGLHLAGVEAGGFNETLALAGRNLDNLSSQFVGSVGSLDKAQAAVRTARAEVRGFEKDFTQMARTNPVAARRVYDGLVQLSDGSARSQRELARLLDMLTRGEEVYTRHAKHAKDAGDANRQLVGDLDISGQAAEAAAQSWENYVSALTGGTPTITSAFDTALDAAERWAEATKKSVDPQDLINALAQQAEAVRNFTANLQLLISEGLTDLAADLAVKGPVAAGQIAQALVDSTPETRRAAEEQVDAVNSAYADWNAYLKGPLAEQLRNTAFGVGQGVGTGTSGGLRSTTGQVADASGAVRAAVEGGMFGTYEIGYNAGLAAGVGIAAGIRGAIPGISRAAEDAAIATLTELDRILRVGSPSKETMLRGRWVGEGFALGMLQTERYVSASGRRLAMRAIGSISPGGGFAGGGGSSVTTDRSITVTGGIHNYGLRDTRGQGTVRALRTAQWLTG